MTDLDDDELPEGYVDPVDATSAAVKALLDEITDPDCLHTVGLMLMAHGLATLANRTPLGNAGAAAELRRLADMVPLPRLN